MFVWLAAGRTNWLIRARHSGFHRTPIFARQRSVALNSNPIYETKLAHTISQTETPASKQASSSQLAMTTTPLDQLPLLLCVCAYLHYLSSQPYLPCQLARLSSVRVTPRSKHRKKKEGGELLVFGTMLIQLAISSVYIRVSYIVLTYACMPSLKGFPTTKKEIYKKMLHMQSSILAIDQYVGLASDFYRTQYLLWGYVIICYL